MGQQQLHRPSDPEHRSSTGLWTEPTVHPLVYTHDCVAKHPSTIIGKFADDTVVVGMISNNDETAYREEVEHLTSWCKENNLLLNVSKTKEMVMDFRRSTVTPHLPITINGTPVEIVDSYKYLGVHISADLTMSLLW